MNNTSIPRPDYPRPQFVRNDWINLNGEWEFEFDDQRQGDREKWYEGHEFSGNIIVPFCFQSEFSGIGDTDFHDQVWYRKKVTLPTEFAGKRVILHFGAVDYQAWVWVNGRLAVFHEGGHTPFSAEITDLLHDGIHSIVVKVRDFSHDLALPRGKQYWNEKSEGIWYTRTTGIWQTVWMEAVEDTYLRKVKLTPDIDSNSIEIRAFVQGDVTDRDIRLQTTVTFGGEPVAEETRQIRHPETKYRFCLHDFVDHSLGRLWTPEKPHLYDVRFTLFVDGRQTDEVTSYFGMRKISIVDGQICLNNKPYYMKLVLDQGYFPGGLLTPPSDEAIIQDVELTKKMGFNGARKHQKVEDPRYLYWCDRMGLLVWGEMANSQAYSEEYAHRFMQEWQEAIERDYNHPCLVAWVPLNESWGVNQILVDSLQQQHALAMYHITKSLDRTRPVISNDGWEHVQSDICTIHDYESKRDVLEQRYSTVGNAVNSKPSNNWIYVPGFTYDGAPIIVSEYGGIAFQQGGEAGWGYSSATNERDFIERYMDVTQPLLRSPIVQGFCYTQLTDVEQEINGLLTYDRKPKVPLDMIKLINDGKQPEGY
ncbi:glycoside hydrolase family 2 protein [Cohnella silvisoli]|uniref:Glycoside hydrolase family 2 TIM barrel-domain containing protein n=1 Tax=Cohnella silvisoli TaxID=2873699 RepID=A0ABV1KML5_9BACL|nr:glycoside hydrolase family 2 TIM barrel-domain containing protein [Cohnella silvisoli]MCD9020606.1 glycoside hydrolase family 2 [Cohnella silvisoli]